MIFHEYKVAVLQTKHGISSESHLLDVEEKVRQFGTDLDKLIDSHQKIRVSLRKSYVKNEQLVKSYQQLEKALNASVSRNQKIREELKRSRSNFQCKLTQTDIVSTADQCVSADISPTLQRSEQSIATQTMTVYKTLHKPTPQNHTNRIHALKSSATTSSTLTPSETQTISLSPSHTTSKPPSNQSRRRIHRCKFRCANAHPTSRCTAFNVLKMDEATYIAQLRKRNLTYHNFLESSSGHSLRNFYQTMKTRAMAYQNFRSRRPICHVCQHSDGAHWTSQCHVSRIQDLSMSEWLQMLRSKNEILFVKLKKCNALVSFYTKVAKFCLPSLRIV